MKYRDKEQEYESEAKRYETQSEYVFCILQYKAKFKMLV